MKQQNLVESFGHELATVVAALLGSTATVTPGEALASGDGWAIAVDTDAAARGSWRIVVGADGAGALTAAVMGLTGEAPPAAVSDTLREAIRQAVSAVSLLDVAAGVELRAGEVVPHAAEVPPGAVTLVVTSPALGVPLTIAVAGAIDVTAVPAAAPAGAAEDWSRAPAGANATAPPDRLDAILDIELPLIVRFGRTELPLRTLAHLGPGSLIDLGRSADDPVDLLVSNRVVARGEVVVVGGNYGVRVLDVVSPRERARSMEA